MDPWGHLRVGAPLGAVSAATGSHWAASSLESGLTNCIGSLLRSCHWTGNCHVVMKPRRFVLQCAEAERLLVKRPED